MLALVAVTAVAVAAVTLAGDEDDDTADAPPAAVGVEDLDAALLTIEDVGSDYVVDFDNDESDTPDADEIDTSDECRMALGVLERSDQAQLGQQVAAQFVDDVGREVRHDIMLPAEGYPGLDTIRGAMDQCGYVEYEYEDEEASASARYETSDVDGLGDHAFSVAMYIEVQGPGGSGALQMNGVFWERDGVVSHVSGGGMDPITFVALPTDPAEVERLAAMADERLTDVLAG